MHHYLSFVRSHNILTFWCIHSDTRAIKVVLWWLAIRLQLRIHYSAFYYIRCFSVTHAHAYHPACSACAELWWYCCCCASCLASNNVVIGACFDNNSNRNGLFSAFILCHFFFCSLLLTYFLVRVCLRFPSETPLLVLHSGWPPRSFSRLAMMRR